MKSSLEERKESANESQKVETVSSALAGGHTTGSLDLKKKKNQVLSVLHQDCALRTLF